ncbi:MAG: hypothetical protein WBK99_10265 [Solirubrobacterales bacterium]
MIKPVLACALALCVPATPAGAAQLGEIAPAGVDDVGGAGVTVVQIASDGTPSYAVPSEGAITAFYIRTGSVIHPDDSVRLRIFRPAGADLYTLATESDVQPLAGRPPGARVGFPVSIAVRAGDLLAGEYVSGIGGNTTIAYASAFPGDRTARINGAPVSPGQTVAGDPPVSGRRINLEATFEPAFTPAPIDTFPPVITRLKTAYKRFRVKHNGLVIAKRAHPGTTFGLNLSEAATVRFDVDKGFRGKIAGARCVRPTRRNARRRSCTRYVAVHSFTRPLATGPNAIPYSARYASRGRTGTLRPGPFRLTATATDHAGNAGFAASIRFKIRR